MAVQSQVAVRCPPELRVRMLEQMLLIREFEDTLVHLTRTTSEIPSIPMTCQGQEAVAVGVCSALKAGDLILSCHRPDGHVIARGLPLPLLAAEIYGRVDGTCGGRGGAMHLQSAKYGVFTATGVVGDQIAMAVGLGLGMKLKKDGAIAVPFFGDGAVGTGLFHESLNLASLWKLPVLFVCENNGYAISTRVATAFAQPDFCKRAESYGVRARRVDGNDVVEVFAAASEAADALRSGQGPFFLECLTYRFAGHSGLDPNEGVGIYRAQEELEERRKFDPIARLEGDLREQGLLKDDQLAGFKAKAAQQVAEAFAFARQSAWPSRDVLKEEGF